MRVPKPRLKLHERLIKLCLLGCLLSPFVFLLYRYMGRRLGWCPGPVVWHDVQSNQLRSQLSEADLKHYRDFKARPRMDRFKEAQLVVATLIVVENRNYVMLRHPWTPGDAELINRVGCAPKIRATLSELVELLGVPQWTERDAPLPDHNLPACDWVYYDCGRNPAHFGCPEPQWRAPYLMGFKARRTDGVVICLVFYPERKWYSR